MLTIRGMTFESVFNASGARGFFNANEEYWHHRLLRPFGLNFDGATFVTKTATLKPRKGNMDLGPRFQPKRLVPDCIVVKPVSGVVLNAVGLSNPGITALVDCWVKWQPPSLTPWIISIAATEDTPEKRAREIGMMTHLIAFAKDRLPPLGVQLNVSCPNVQHPLDDEVGGILNAMERARRELPDTPILIKVSCTMPIWFAMQIAAHPGCDALVCSNTVPWGSFPMSIDWRGLFSSDESPLVRYGGGGLSGRPLFPHVKRWIQDAREHDIKKPIIGGGGILSAHDAEEMLQAGANAVELGSVSILRPWRVKGIIRHVQQLERNQGIK